MDLKTGQFKSRVIKDEDLRDRCSKKIQLIGFLNVKIGLEIDACRIEGGTDRVKMKEEVDRHWILLLDFHGYCNLLLDGIGHWMVSKVKILINQLLNQK
jgi:hypothetical protein